MNKYKVGISRNYYYEFEIVVEDEYSAENLRGIITYEQIVSIEYKIGE